MDRKPISDLPEEDQFLHALGQAMAKWARVESNMCDWLGRATNMTIGQAEAVFFSARSFNGRSNMLAAALEKSKLDPAWVALVSEALSVASRYSAFRNRLAHGLPDSHDGGMPAKGWRLVDKHDWGDGAAPNLAAIRVAAANFKALWEILRDANTGGLRGSPATYLQRLALLPSEADSPELSQKQKGRIRQRQAAERSVQNQ